MMMTVNKDEKSTFMQKCQLQGTVTAPIIDAASNQVLFFGHGPRPIFKRGLKSKNISSDVCT